MLTSYSAVLPNCIVLSHKSDKSRDSWSLNYRVDLLTLLNTTDNNYSKLFSCVTSLGFCRLINSQSVPICVTSYLISNVLTILDPSKCLFVTSYPGFVGHLKLNLNSTPIFLQQKPESVFFAWDPLIRQNLSFWSQFN